MTMNSMIQETLQHLGFSEKEARIYIGLLEIGSNPASTIARYIRENRVTTYSVLKILVKKNIILESKKWGMWIYTSISPEILIEQVKSRTEQLERSLPEFLAIMNQGDRKPKVTLHEWLGGMKNLIQTLLKDLTEHPEYDIFGFLWANNMDKNFEIYLQELLEIKKSKSEEIKTHIIIMGKPDYWYAQYCRDHYITKTIAEWSFPMEHEMFTYGWNKTMILMYHEKELSGMIIESESLARWIRSIFDLVWKSANR